MGTTTECCVYFFNKSWKQNLQNNSFMAIYLPSHEPPKKGEQDMLGTVGEVRMNK